MEHTAVDTLNQCPICASPLGSKRTDIVDHSISHEVFHVTDCPSCGFRLTNPRPSQSSIGRYYQSDTYISHTNSSSTLQDRLYQYARRWALSQKHAIVRSYEPSGATLDIGCGTGEFLGYLKRRGYLVQGVEPNDAAREQAISVHSLTVQGNLNQVSPYEQFRIVTLWHVLEHLPDPSATLKQIFALCAPHGLLVIAVPDRDSWDAEHYGDKWAAWDVPRHLSHFRRQDISKLLSRHGFQLVSKRRMWLDAAYVSILSEKYRGRSPGYALCWGIANGLRSNIASLLSGRPTSSTLFIARKLKA